MSKSQFGFRAGRSTEDAINKASKYVKNSNVKYAIGIFVDIEGALDNVWWPYLINILRDRKCPNNILKIFKNNLHNR